MNARQAVHLLLVALFPCGQLSAQDATMAAPHSPMPRFESLLADPDMTAIGGRVMWLDQSDSQLDDDVQAEAILGENIPIVALARGSRPVSLGLGGSVLVRFGLTAENSPLVAQDWNFQLNVAHRRGPWTFVGMLWHESEHLGDEYVQLFGQGRPAGSREGVTAWVFYQHGPWRIGASAGSALRLSNATGRGRFTGGADYAPARRGGGLLPRASVFLDLDSYANWRPGLSARLGTAVPIAAGTDVTLSLAAYTGPSTLGYFRAELLRYLGVEFRFDL